MDVLVELILQILFEALFQGLIEGLFDLARGSRRRARLGPEGVADVSGHRPLDSTSRAAVFGVITVIVSLALGAWRGVARADDGPGFGLAVAVVVAIGCAAVARRRRRSHRQEDGGSSMFSSTGRPVLPLWISASLTTSRLVWFAIANAVFAVAYVAGLAFAPAA